MVNISPLGLNNSILKKITAPNIAVKKKLNSSTKQGETINKITSSNLIAYHPSFSAKKITQPSKKEQIKTINSKLDKTSIKTLKKLDKNGILDNNNSDDDSSVLDNLYKIATEPRIAGLSTQLILSEVIKTLDNPSVISQRFGDIPNEVALQIEDETKLSFPKEGMNVISSTCVAASIQYTLASKKPAEFVRFIQGLTSPNYSVEKTVKLSDIEPSISKALWKLRKFNTESKISTNWEDVTIKIKPDRNAIVRARIQTSYQDKGERSCTDVLFQSALLHLCSQGKYDSITDTRRSTEFNTDTSGLSEIEKNFGEKIIFEMPKKSILYQIIDENGYLVDYTEDANNLKQHILKSLELGENVIAGYTHIDSELRVHGGHEITITNYREDAQGNGYFICNDTDDGIDTLIELNANELLPQIHHAGISLKALNETNTEPESWREILEQFQAILAEEK